MTLRNYSNTATEAALIGTITAVDTTLSVSSFSGFPAPPFTAAIDRGTALEEIVYVTAAAGADTATLAVTRGYDGTTAKTHDAGAPFLHVTVARDFAEANSHVNAVTGVHGVSGNPVGTTGAQTISNKTLVAPTVTGTAAMVNASLSGTLAVAGATTLAGLTTTGDAAVGGTHTVTGATSLADTSVTGTLTVTGASTLAALTATTGAFSGNVTVGGTLGVTGKATVGSLQVTGASTLAAVTATTLAASGNATVGGTLTVTGASSFTGAVTVPAPTAGGHAVTKTYADTMIRPLMYVQAAAPTGTIPDGALWFQTS